jgi:HK97 family phage major capsid protein
MKTVKELREERAGIIAKQKQILDAANEAKRNLTTEESAQWDKLDTEAEGIKATAERLERQSALNAEMEAREDEQRANGRPKPEGNKDEQRAQAFEAYLRRGLNNLAPEQQAIIQELRAQSTVAAEGGYTIPKQMASAIQEGLKAFGGMRAVASSISTSGGGVLSYPTSNDTGNVGALISENAAVTEQDVTFGNIDFNAYTYSSKMIRVSNQLLQDSAFDLGAYIQGKIAERIGRITNTHFTTGTGSSQPKGVSVAATLGKTAASNAAITFDELIDLLHSVDPAHRVNASWMFNDSTLKALKKLKDSQGQYIWQPGVAGGVPDTILNHKYTINQDVASIATVAKTVLFGDFSKYLIRDVQGISILRLSERYADYNQTAFLAFSRHDGNLLDAGTNPVKFLQHAV